MRILFDHCINIELAAHVVGHEIHSAEQMGWAKLGNGELLKAASDAAFEVFVTIEGNLVHQQN